MYFEKDIYCFEDVHPIVRCENLESNMKFGEEWLNKLQNQVFGKEEFNPEKFYECLEQVAHCLEADFFGEFDQMVITKKG